MVLIRLVLILYFPLFITSDLPIYKPITGEINKTVKVDVKHSLVSIIIYNYSKSEDINNETTVKIHINSQSILIDPVLIIIKHDEKLVSSIELPINQSDVFAERTICPNLNVLNRILSVEISSASLESVPVFVNVSSVKNFVLKKGTTLEGLMITENAPLYFLYNFDTVPYIVIEVNSNETCSMILSIQNNKCPINDESSNIKYTGIYQTVTKKGTITVEKNHNFKNQIFIVFLLIDNDENCKKMPEIGKSSILRQKTFTVEIKELEAEYTKAILLPIGLFLLFYLFSAILSFIYKHCCASNTQVIEVLENEENIYCNKLEDPVSYGSIIEQADMETIYSNKYRTDFNPSESGSSSNIVVHINSQDNKSDDSYDSLSDVQTDPNIYRLNRLITLADFSRKPSQILKRKYFLYFWYIVIISVFYSLPVVQLVINYQQNLLISGNLDTCFYNFRCTRPLYIFTAFNNIISNIGYVLLGILFTFVTWRREHLYDEHKYQKNNNKYSLGIPQYYGLFYAMGLSLTMEGIMSACYHICPSSNNFQFDTAYMYIIACLCTIKIYQTRHPDINVTAHSFFMTMALFIFIGVLGVVAQSKAFWIVFTILYLVFIIFLTCETYYMGRWRIDSGSIKRIYIIIQNDKWKIFIPTYRNRMIILCFTNAVNLGLIIYGIICQPKNFGFHFLSIFMINLMLYFAFYIIMKMVYCEKFHKLSIVYVSVGLLCWILAVICFYLHPTDWQKTPAESRNENRDCWLLKFYDVHDIWHFLSAVAMFFSFMTLQNIDDCLFLTERNQIEVF